MADTGGQKPGQEEKVPERTGQNVIPWASKGRPGGQRHLGISMALMGLPVGAQACCVALWRTNVVTWRHLHFRVVTLSESVFSTLSRTNGP